MIIKVDKIMKTGYNYIVRKVRNLLLENGGFYMELAKVTSKGQITIPIEIRKKLGIKNGDKILFVEESGRIWMHFWKHRKHLPERQKGLDLKMMMM